MRLKDGGFKPRADNTAQAYPVTINSCPLPLFITDLPVFHRDSSCYIVKVLLIYVIYCVGMKKKDFRSLPIDVDDGIKI